MSYLVETYGHTRTEDVDLIETQLRATTAAMAAEGTAVEFLGAVLVPGDETIFLLFDGPSAELVEVAFKRAGVAFERMVEAQAPVRWHRPMPHRNAQRRRLNDNDSPTTALARTPESVNDRLSSDVTTPTEPDHPDPPISAAPREDSRVESSPTHSSRPSKKS